MEEAIEMIRGKDMTQRIAGVESLHNILDQCRKSLTAKEVGNLVDALLVLLKDNNFRMSQGALQVLALPALAREHLKVHFNVLLPAIVERLGDGKQPVRDAACRLLFALMEISSPAIIVEKAGSCAWMHKSWRVREEFARTVASAINLFATSELPLQRVLLPSVIKLLEDSNNNVREAALVCLEELFRQGGPQFCNQLQRHPLRPARLKEINMRFEKIEPSMHSLDGTTGQLTATEGKYIAGQFAMVEVRSSASLPMGGNRRSSQKEKCALCEASQAGGDIDVIETPVEPIKVYSEKELTREIEKISGTLTPEHDWSVRMNAMQKVEGLVFGGALDYACFPTLLKQLIGPLNFQLSDRRSSVVKKACHLLSLLSKELRENFEAFAESFLPALFKLVVITVLVISESADNCIKMLLRNCKVARALTRIVDCAKCDRNAVLRARCCEYAMIVLGHWADAPEIQQSADHYEDLIKCCVGDAMAEVRSMAIMCYHTFAKIWPDRSHCLFETFDPVIQKLIKEDGGVHEWYASPSLHDRGTQQIQIAVTASVNGQPSATAIIPGYGTSAIVAVDQSASLFSEHPFHNADNVVTTKRKLPERSIESTLQARQQQVNTVDGMLRGTDALEKGNISSTHPLSKDPAGGSYRKIHASACSARRGVDSQSGCDLTYPAIGPAAYQVRMHTAVSDSSGSSAKGSVYSCVDAIVPNVAPSQVPVSIDVGTSSVLSNANHEVGTSSMLIPYPAERFPMALERLDQGTFIKGSNDVRTPKQIIKLESQRDKISLETRYKDISYKDSQFKSIPNFEMPVKQTWGLSRSSRSIRSSIEDNQPPTGEIIGFKSLNDALTGGLSVSPDWSARVAAFNYLQKLLQQGSRGFQEVTHSFDRVMKLFSEHLDNPHHKVAQAAISALVELVPACRKPFEGYLDRILPHVFSRLVDPKETIRQLCTSTLEIVGNTYGIDSLLPALLRSFDEQRSLKAKIAVIEFAIVAFSKLTINGESSCGSGLLKLWLAKLAPLVNDKNPKLRETVVAGIISVYYHFDSTTILSFISGLSVEEQSTLRKALKQYNPRIEVDLINFLQNRNQRTRSRSLYCQSNGCAVPCEEGNAGPVTRGQSSKLITRRYLSISTDSNSDRKWSSVQEQIQSFSDAQEVCGYGESKDSRDSLDATAGNH